MQESFGWRAYGLAASLVFAVSTIGYLGAGNTLRCGSGQTFILIAAIGFGAALMRSWAFKDSANDWPHGLGTEIFQAFASMCLGVFFFAPPSALGWFVGAVAASQYQGAIVRPHCPVPVDPLWLDDALRTLESNDPLGIRP